MFSQNVIPIHLTTLKKMGSFQFFFFKQKIFLKQNVNNDGLEKSFENFQEVR